VTDKPILFSGAMVRSLLAGTKTQTRRLYGPGHHTLTEPVSPRIKMGDRLYVREHWRTSHDLDPIPPRDLDVTIPIYHEATNLSVGFAGKMRQAMHMPKWASRITLIVTDVRVQHLQEITEEDAIAEGVEKVFYDGSDKAYIGASGWKDYRDHPHACVPFIEAKNSYETLWDEINAEKAPWSSNPWVVAYTFRCIQQHIDQVSA
jgi:hypothetical protein